MDKHTHRESGREIGEKRGAESVRETPAPDRRQTAGNREGETGRERQRYFLPAM
jgi:hypothetical protein